MIDADGKSAFSAFAGIVFSGSTYVVKLGDTLSEIVHKLFIKPSTTNNLSGFGAPGVV